MKINGLSRWGISLACICLILSSCHAPYFGPSVAETLKHTDVYAAVSSECTKEDFENIKKVAVIFKPSQTDLANVTDAVAAKVTIELIRLGVAVVEKERVDKLIDEWRVQTKDLDEYNLYKIGNNLGVDAVVSVSVSSVIRHDTYDTGVMGVGYKTTNAVQNASLKIIGCEKGKTMMAISVDYKYGQKPRDAARAMAVIIKDKLQNPFG